MAKDLLAIARQTKYPFNAFLFVQEGLDFTVKRIHGEADPAGPKAKRHVSGRDLCLGLRDVARERYGLLARTVLRRWNINCCEDFGRIVFALVEAGLLQKTDEDTMRDFVGVFDFAEAFDDSVLLAATAK